MLFKWFLKLLWLVYRLRLFFTFVIKIILIYKIFSIFLDIYLGFYPKIFNDIGLKLFLEKFYNWLDLHFFFYPKFINIIILFFFIYIYIFWPFFKEIRKPFESMKSSDSEKKEEEVDSMVEKKEKVLHTNFFFKKNKKKLIRKKLKEKWIK